MSVASLSLSTRIFHALTVATATRELTQTHNHALFYDICVILRDSLLAWLYL